MAAIAFLDFKGYYVSKKMFLHALYGSGNVLAPEVIEVMVDLLQKDKGFMDRAKATIENKNRYGRFDDYEFKEGDLHYCIQHCTVFVNEVFFEGRRGIRVIVTDAYNFDDFRLISDGITFSNAANDLGYALQLSNMLTWYNFEVSFTYYY